MVQSVTQANRYEQLDLRGRKVLVMGLGTRQGGAGVTRYLVNQGATVTVTDLRAADELRETLSSLQGLPVTYRLGEHREEDFDATELVVRNPGVPVTSKWLQRAIKRGVPVEMEMSLFFRACPGVITGITGTKGKTSTATLCAEILRQRRSDTILAGNMGTSALDQLSEISSETPVVLELSSWQLEGLADYGMSPPIAVLTNISEDHLNRYESMAHYIDAKRTITRYQTADDWFVVNRNDPVCWAMRHDTIARTVPFGVLNEGEDGAALVDGWLKWQWKSRRMELIDRKHLPIAGEHAVSNSLAASAAAILQGSTGDDVRAALSGARPVPHRQELVATVNGVDYINDTTATAPAAAIAALHTYADRRIVLIAGGAAKNTSMREFAREAAARASGIVLLDGDETANLQSLLREFEARHLSEPLRSMEEAVNLAAMLATPGSVVLLSPGCASFGLFRDEFHRGEAFRDAVRRLQSRRNGGDE